MAIESQAALGSGGLAAPASLELAPLGSAQSKERTTLGNLPFDALERILSFASFQDLTKTVLVSREFRKVSDSPMLLKAQLKPRYIELSNLFNFGVNRVTYDLVRQDLPQPKEILHKELDYIAASFAPGSEVQISDMNLIVMPVAGRRSFIPIEDAPQFFLEKLDSMDQQQRIVVRVDLGPAEFIVVFSNGIFQLWVSDADPKLFFMDFDEILSCHHGHDTLYVHGYKYDKDHAQQFISQSCDLDTFKVKEVLPRTGDVVTNATHCFIYDAISISAYKMKADGCLERDEVWKISQSADMPICGVEVNELAVIITTPLLKKVVDASSGEQITDFRRIYQVFLHNDVVFFNVVRGDFSSLYCWHIPTKLELPTINFRQYSYNVVNVEPTAKGFKFYYSTWSVGGLIRRESVFKLEEISPPLPPQAIAAAEADAKAEVAIRVNVPLAVPAPSRTLSQRICAAMAQCLCCCCKS